MAFAGFNNSKKRSTINNGDWDRDGVVNRKDCEPLNFKKQGPEHEKRNREREAVLSKRYRELLDRDIEDYSIGIRNTGVKRGMKEIEDELDFIEKSRGRDY